MTSKADKQNIHDLIELNKQLQENAVKSYNKGYNQALKDVEKIGRSESPANIKPTDDYFIFISQKRWERLKAKGE